VTHYHIRWSRKSHTILDWERFDTPDDANNAAEQLVLPHEGYTIEQFDGNCPRCAEKHAHDRSESP
jgi:hypothetical protein